MNRCLESLRREATKRDLRIVCFTNLSGSYSLESDDLGIIEIGTMDEIEAALKE